MNLVSPISARERILVYGAPTSGKSEALLTIANKCQDAHFWILDNDCVWEQVLWNREVLDEGKIGNVLYKEFAPNLTVFQIFDWEDYNTATDYVVENAKEDDWFCVDMITHAWQEVQNNYFESVHEKSISDYAIAARQEREKKRREGKQAEPLASRNEYQYINPIYFEWQKKMLKLNAITCHVFCAAETAKIGDSDDRAIKELFEPVGAKPKGQGRIAFFFNTIVLTKKTQTMGHTFSTIKEGKRGRKIAKDQEWEDFGKEYLIKIAKWKPEKKEVAEINE